MKYHTLDVFTDTVFGGNPLAVFPDADGIPPGMMQRIARELNLSETVFVQWSGAPEGTDCRVRIFTPGTELPFAGHPTVGTACLLGLLGRAGERVVLGETVGPIPVEVRIQADQPSFAMFTAARVPELGPAPPPAEVVAQLLSLDPVDVGGSLGTAFVSSGVPFLVVSVRDRAALGRAHLDVLAWQRHLSDAWGPHVYVVTDDAEGGTTLRARMFAPAMGIPEDPATGAAAAALAGLLARRDAVEDGTLRWVVEQGVEMGRPSRIHIEADVRGGSIAAVRVGGSAVRVSEGEMTLPDE
ncbi:MAG TPA: PhzF family phenazine biosynthesis protein [Longimicrobium sp.]|nr:PhzF family phenazine biosynthesis protein [Longimicrobium sp.]HEX6038940.1 PhzF family phenazine biosynthesis protein [Longimicrobium sp.]